ncbi:M23 family metallopeptidase [Ekhidna sp.]
MEISGNKKHYDRALKDNGRITANFVYLVLSVQKELFPLKKERREWDGILGDNTFERGEAALNAGLSFENIINVILNFFKTVGSTASHWWNAFIGWLKGRDVTKITKEKGGVRLPLSSKGSGYGWRGAIGSKGRHFHRGLDQPTRYLSKDNKGEIPVGVVAKGTVVFVRKDYKNTYPDGPVTYGAVVYVNHGNGLVTRYGHLSKIDVGKGQELVEGEIIGITGNSGFSTGPHLHFEIRKNVKDKNGHDGTSVNPKIFNWDKWNDDNS